MNPQAMRKSNSNLPMLRVQKLMNFSDRLIQIFQYAFNPFAKKLSHGSQLQVSPLLHKKVHAKLFFQLMNLTTHR